MFALCRGQGRAAGGTSPSCQGLSAEASALLVTWASGPRRPIKGQPQRCFPVGSPARLLMGKTLRAPLLSCILQQEFERKALLIMLKYSVFSPILMHFPVKRLPLIPDYLEKKL